MGGDCCGGPPADAATASSKSAPSPAVAAAAAAIAALKVADEAGKKAGEHAGAGADGAAPPAAKSHADHVASMQAYIAKRISLFEQYHAREAEKVCGGEGRGSAFCLGASVPVLAPGAGTGRFPCLGRAPAV